MLFQITTATSRGALTRAAARLCVFSRSTRLIPTSLQILSAVWAATFRAHDADRAHDDQVLALLALQLMGKQALSGGGSRLALARRHQLIGV